MQITNNPQQEFPIDKTQDITSTILLKVTQQTNGGATLETYFSLSYINELSLPKNYFKMIVNAKATKSEGIFANYIPDKGLIFKIHKELRQLNRKKYLIKNEQNI